MVRSSIIPLAERQRLCSQFLDEYFTVHGDTSPDSDEVMLQIMNNGSLYRIYAKQYAGRHPVVPSAFNQLWRVCWAKYRKRHYCDIPGSCDICYEVDRGRREEHDLHKAKMWQEIHLLHRGGMFMLERES